MKKRTTLMWVIGMLLIAAITVSAQDNQAAGETARTNPMKKTDVIKALESNAISGAELAQRIAQRGVDFEVNEKTEQELKSAGAGAEVVDAARSNYVAKPKKKGFFDKMNEGLNKATGKMKEATEKVEGGAAPLLLPPPLAAAVIAAQQVKKLKDAKAKKSETGSTATEGEAPAPTAAENSAPATGTGETKPPPAEKPETVEEPSPQNAMATGAAQPEMAGGFPNLTGTGWKILDIRNKGDKPKGGRTVVPTFIFCKSGKWDIVRYGLAPGNAGAVGQIGTYTVSGGTLTTKNNTDGMVGNYKMTWLAEENILELEEGNIVMRLQYNGETTC